MAGSAACRLEPRHRHRRGDARHDHADARQHDRQRRAAAYARQLLGGAGRGHLGADLLHRRRRDRHAAHRLARARISAPSGCCSARWRASPSPRCCAASPAASIRWWRSASPKGICGAALVPLAQTMLLNIYPREKAGGAMAIWGAGVMLGPIIGPTLGGWLTDAYNWRWVFYINVPIGIIAFLTLASFAQESPTHRRGFDFFGFAMLSLAVGALQLMLDRGEYKDWLASNEIRVELGIAIAALLGVPRPFGDVVQPVRQSRPVQGSEFLVRQRADVPGQRRDPRLDGAAADLAAGRAQLSGGDGGRADDAARLRHRGLDAARRQADRALRRPPSHARPASLSPPIRSGFRAAGPSTWVGSRSPSPASARASAWA